MTDPDVRRTSGALEGRSTVGALDARMIVERYRAAKERRGTWEAHWQDDFGESAPIFAPGASQQLAVGAVSAQSAAFAARTSAVLLFADQDCFVALGDDPAALADGSHMLLPAGETRVVKVRGGDKLAAIRRSADGPLFVTELR